MGMDLVKLSLTQSFTLKLGNVCWLGWSHYSCDIWVIFSVSWFGDDWSASFGSNFQAFFFELYKILARILHFFIKKSVSIKEQT